MICIVDENNKIINIVNSPYLIEDNERKYYPWNNLWEEYTDIEPLDYAKNTKHKEVGVVFAGKRDAIRQVTISDGNTYGFDTCSEDITNFMASWKAAEESGQTLYKVWKDGGSKGMIVMKLEDFTTVFNTVRDSQYAAYAWYEQITAKIEQAQSKEELDAIILE